MKHIISLSLLVLLITACSKDTILPEEDPEIKTSYVKAKINQVPFCLYQDSVYNYDRAEFSFGTAILSKTDSEEVIDSSLTIRANIGDVFISLQFPYRKAVDQKSISLHRSTPDITYHWASAGLESVNLINGIQQGLFYTTYCFYEESKLTEPVGEISITSFDAINKNISGTFSFTAYGYKHEQSRIVDTNEQLVVEDGQFYIEWENELFK
ncbi:DUF6252 family protein [Carboxylicivirga sp. M1479]|uniref:DUF6252 family protein n=1 Tax=Carboxylicivirga sp. M1479 TaxID=2594476 RepID=UPI001178392E|nr:DUF6252 family protein [Carboxylicivirga sp. M1479]TRX70307.1 hypothetical protein FNN09_12555 [Carboxylicivirga sp. M1479]